jgi:hypothetical protein
MLYRFYRIVGSGDKEYVGGTRQPLHKRFYKHKNDYKSGRRTCHSYKVFDLYGIENCSIILICELECESKQHALKEERRIYEERREQATNRNRPLISEEEKATYMKAYYEENKEEIRAQKREYMKAYRENLEKPTRSKEEIATYAKAYYEKNKEEIRAQKREYMKAYREKKKQI